MALDANNYDNYIGMVHYSKQEAIFYSKEFLNNLEKQSGFPVKFMGNYVFNLKSFITNSGESIML